MQVTLWLDLDDAICFADHKLISFRRKLCSVMFPAVRIFKTVQEEQVITYRTLKRVFSN